MPNQQPSPEISRPDAKAEQPEIIELKDRIESLEASLKKEKEPMGEKIAKQEIKKYLRELQKVPVTAPPVTTRDEAKEISKFPVTQQVGALISLVFDKGLETALSVARELDNPAILDEFHDILVDRYYEELIKKKILRAL